MMLVMSDPLHSRLKTSVDIVILWVMEYVYLTVNFFFIIVHFSLALVLIYC